MNLIYAQTPLEINRKSIFLAGPTPRSKDVQSWRPKAIKMFAQSPFSGTLLIPEIKGGWHKDFAYADQIEWELEAMEQADIILFWIPRDIKTMPAFTTNTEFGYWLAKDPSKIRLGIPAGAEKCDYIKYIAEKNGVEVFSHFDILMMNTIKGLNNG